MVSRYYTHFQNLSKTNHIFSETMRAKVAIESRAFPFLISLYASTRRSYELNTGLLSDKDDVKYMFMHYDTAQ